MKIKFNVFNNGQKHCEFDTDLMEEGMELNHFNVAKDRDGTIYIVPVLIHKKTDTLVAEKILEYS